MSSCPGLRTLLYTYFEMCSGTFQNKLKEIKVPGLDLHEKPDLPAPHGQNLQLQEWRDLLESALPGIKQEPDP